MILRLYLKITKKKFGRPPVKPNPPPWDVPLDQTTAPMFYVDGLPYV